ncbi:hypothetical protein D5S17_35915 [Pseudonocardiaceae bacterium YIM PH 21723]|nr:hypothetical protein D5S17_35915 [Pseudonocardiaceae bacterium YIM PH 21723]
MQITVDTFNYEQGGRDATGSHNIDPLIETMDSRRRPDIFFLQEAVRWIDDGGEVLRRTTGRLSELLPGRAQYLPFVGHREKSPHPTIIYVRSDVVDPLRWWCPRLEPTTGENYENILRADIGGRKIDLKSVHAKGLLGGSHRMAQATVLQQIANRPLIIGGDFNGTPSGPRFRRRDPRDVEKHTPHKLSQEFDYDWDKHRWFADTRPMDLLLGPWIEQAQRRAEWGRYLCANELELDGRGQPVERLTSTVNPQPHDGGAPTIDFILFSKALRATVVPGSVEVQIPDPGKKAPSDHRPVRCALELDV